MKTVNKELDKICSWLLENYKSDFTDRQGKFYFTSRLSIAEIILKYNQSPEQIVKSR